MNDLRAYTERLISGCGSAWIRFWFTATDGFVLCVLRILAGMLALYFVLSHSADLIRWFGPDGMLHAAAARQLTGADQLTYSFRFSYLYFAETPLSLWILHVAGLLVLLAYTVGFWSRITNIGALIVVLSYIHRGPMLTSQFEPVLSMVLAYLCLAPTGRYLSLDAWLAGRGTPTYNLPARGDTTADKSVAANIATRLMQLHVAGLCVMIGLNMLASDVWWSGEAVWWLIARSESRLIDLTGLAHAMMLIELWTHGIVAYQLVFGLLVWNRLARPLLLCWGVVIWISLALITGLVAWCTIMLVASLAFVDSAWLRRVVRCTPTGSPASSGPGS